MMQSEIKVSQTVEPLAAYEVKKAQWSLIAMMIMGVVCFLLAIIIDVMIISAGYLNRLGWAWILFPYVFVSVGYATVFYKWFPLPFEYRKGTKVVADTTVIRLKKLGFSDVDASEPGGMPQMLFGSVFYLYVKDPTRRSGQRKFRIKKNLYDALRPGDEVTIGYLPKTCMMFYLDRGSFHYEPTRRVKGT